MQAPENDNTNGWSAGLKFPTFSPFRGSDEYDLVIIGAGYTGLSAALTLRAEAPSLRIALVDGQQPGQGASARNSGYLVDSTLNDGHLSDTGLQSYRSKYELARLALEHVQARVEQWDIDCDWAACGKYHAGQKPEIAAKLDAFSGVLSELKLEHRRLSADELHGQLGTDYYRHGVWTAGAVMLNPAKLALGLVQQLRDVDVFGDSPVMAMDEKADGVLLTLPGGQIRAQQVILATNATLRAFGQKRTFPLYLTASLTHPIPESAWSDAPSEYGILAAQPMGATVRWTSDRRLMIRNTAQVDTVDPHRWQTLHLQGLQRRFPFVTQQMLAYTWGGYTCISGNNANVFEQASRRIFRAGCYNGGGIGLSILFGEQIGLAALGVTTDVQARIFKRPVPNWLPPQPFLGAGVRMRLARDRRAARSET